MIFGIEFRDENDKRELVETAQTAKEAVCDLWEKLAEHMPELHEIQERNGRYRNGGGYGMGGWNGNLGYRNYGGGSNYRNGGYAPIMGGYGPFMGGNGQFRENPAYAGGNDRRGW
ncbi:MAG: hypothetical protein IJV24_07400 [Prevotella sp.]|nr:hypothetical protein [Prevotella sp.]